MMASRICLKLLRPAGDSINRLEADDADREAIGPVEIDIRKNP
jgi:hypothetical protein